MPGGMGGGLMGSLMKGAMGGMNRNPPGDQMQAAQNIVDDYDVTRWQRADGLDVVPTMVQTVRADWDRKKSEKQERSPLKKLFSKFKRKNETKPAAASEPEPRPAGGTIVAPEMKKASQRINPAAERDATAQQMELPRHRDRRCDVDSKNYLGLSFRSEIDDFFTVNPVNSAILAVDSLGMGMLTLNQITAVPEPNMSFEVSQVNIQRDIAGQPSPGNELAGDLQNPMTQRMDTGYMNEFHKSRELQKYNVRIRD